MISAPKKSLGGTFGCCEEENGQRISMNKYFIAINQRLLEKCVASLYISKEEQNEYDK